MKLTEEVYLVGSGAAGIGLTDDYDCHVYLINGGGELALVDAGAGLGVSHILNVVRADGFHLNDIRYVLITHTHADHAGGAARLGSELDAAFYVSAQEAAFLRDADEEAVGLTFAREAGFYPSDYRLEPCAVDRELHDGEVFHVGDLSVKAILLPGHSIGSMLYLVQGKEQRYLFSSDSVLFGGMISLLNCVGSSLEDYRNHIGKLSGLGVDALLPGHLNFCLKGGQEQLDKAVEAFKGLGVPTTMIGRHGLIISQ